MSFTHDQTVCSECGAVIDTTRDTPTARAPCPTCGGLRRTICDTVAETCVARAGIGIKVKRPGERRPHIEDSAMPSHSHGRGKVVHREQIIDRDNDRYFERVTDYETGEVIHHTDEPLSQHKGHGTEKARVAPPEKTKE